MYMIQCWINARGVVLDRTLTWLSFDGIFRRRPSGCRYAVCHAQMDFAKNRHEIIVFDMFDAREQSLRAATQHIIPGRHWVYDDLDAAIAATILAYGVEHG